MIIDIHAQLGRHPLFGFEQTATEILSDMRRYRIDKSFVVPVPRMRFKEANDAVSRAVTRNPKKLVGFFNVNPHDPESAGEVDRAVCDLGLKGMFLDPEFHTKMERPLTVGDKLLPPLFEKAVEYDLPVLISVPNIRVGHLNDTALQMRDGLEELLQLFPEVRTVVDIFWPGVVGLAKTHSKLYVDTAGASAGRVSEFSAKGLTTRMFFGSNSPRYHPGNHLQTVRWARLARSQEEMVLGKNASRVFKDVI